MDGFAGDRCEAGIRNLLYIVIFIAIPLPLSA